MTLSNIICIAIGRYAIQIRGLATPLNPDLFSTIGITDMYVFGLYLVFLPWSIAYAISLVKSAIKLI